MKVNQTVYQNEMLEYCKVKVLKENWSQINITYSVLYKDNRLP